MIFLKIAFAVFGLKTARNTCPINRTVFLVVFKLKIAKIDA
jgi:hypothetical protein